MKIETTNTGLDLRRIRLSEQVDYVPWVRAEQQLEDCFLFWMPVSGFPMQHDEKEWISEFLNRLTKRLEQDHVLRSELFLQYKQITPQMGDTVRGYFTRCMKLLGLGRFANQDLPSFPTPEQVKEAVDSGNAFDFRDWIGDYLIWFVGKQPVEQRRLFFGHGGMTTIFLPPDPKMKRFRLPFTPAFRQAMPLFQKVDVDAMIEGTAAMKDAFLEKSKALFGEGLEEKPEFPGLAFILPLLDSQHFFIAGPELRERWFSLFDVYVNESKKDKGVLLAFRKEEYKSVFLDVVESMKADKLHYRVNP
jgi:hypothetical protein